MNAPGCALSPSSVLTVFAERLGVRMSGAPSSLTSAAAMPRGDIRFAVAVRVGYFDTARILRRHGDIGSREGAIALPGQHAERVAVGTGDGEIWNRVKVEVAGRENQRPGAKGNLRCTRERGAGAIQRMLTVFPRVFACAMSGQPSRL